MRYLDPKASYEENKAMYRMLSDLYHPDRPETGNEEMMKEINAEWESIQKLHKNAEFNTDNLPDKIHDKKHSLKDGKMPDKMGDKIMDNEETTDGQPMDNGFKFNGTTYYGSPDEIKQQVALRHGGMALMELTNNHNWENYCETWSSNLTSQHT